jgi:hypothetical protein
MTYEQARAAVSARQHREAAERFAARPPWFRRRRVALAIAASVALVASVVVATFHAARPAVADPVTIALPSGTNLTISDVTPGSYFYVTTDGPVTLAFAGTDGVYVYGDNVGCVAGGGTTDVPRPVPNWNAVCDAAGVVYGLARNPLGITCDNDVYVGMDFVAFADGPPVLTVPLIASDWIGQPCGNATTTTTTEPPTTTTTTEPPTTTTTLDPTPPTMTQLVIGSSRHVHSGKGGAYACVTTYHFAYPDGTVSATYSVRVQRGSLAFIRDPLSSQSWALSCR